MKNWSLLLAPFGILLSGLIVLYLKAHPQSGIIHTESLLGISYLPWLAAVIVAAVVMQGVLVRRHMDTCLFPLVMLLASIGVVEIARLKPALLIPQLRWLLIAMVLMFFVIRFWNRIGRLVDYPYITGICCVVVLFLPILFGTEILPKILGVTFRARLAPVAGPVLEVVTKLLHPLIRLSEFLFQRLSSEAESEQITTADVVTLASLARAGKAIGLEQENIIVNAVRLGHTRISRAMIRAYMC